ncbi:MAG: hypothetical protein ACI8RD_014836, partial [Bacillariaceae sp.]
VRLSTSLQPTSKFLIFLQASYFSCNLGYQ